MISTSSSAQPLVFRDSGGRSWVVSTLELAGRGKFGIICDDPASAATDPVADSYRAGSLAPMATLTEIALNTLVPGDRVLDLGAHLGGFALAAASLGCEVLAFEAAPRYAALLQLSATYNRFHNLQVFHAAVGDENGSLEFSCHGPWGHLATPVTAMASMTVPAVRVDDVLQQRGWDGARFVKLDVEGSEVRALRGLRRLLQGAAAPLIFFESNEHTLAFYGHTAEDLLAELRGMGYRIYDVSAAALSLVRPWQRQAQTVTDYLAAKILPPGLAARER